MGALAVAHELFAVACGIQFPDQQLNPGLLHWECGVLATGPVWKSWFAVFSKPASSLPFQCPTFKQGGNVSSWETKKKLWQLKISILLKTKVLRYTSHTICFTKLKLSLVLSDADGFCSYLNVYTGGIHVLLPPVFNFNLAISHRGKGSLGLLWYQQWFVSPKSLGLEPHYFAALEKQTTQCLLISSESCTVITAIILEHFYHPIKKPMHTNSHLYLPRFTIFNLGL